MGHREKNLKQTVKMVESVIRDLGLTPEHNRLDAEGPAWGLARGSAEVFVFVNPGGENERGNHIQCVSPVMKLPETPTNQLAIFQRMLRLNATELAGAAFGLKGDTVVLTTDRSTIDLDPSEVRDMILRVGYFADVYDDDLVNEFGGKRHADTGR